MNRLLMTSEGEILNMAHVVRLKVGEAGEGWTILAELASGRMAKVGGPSTSSQDARTKLKQLAQHLGAEDITSIAGETPPETPAAIPRSEILRQAGLWNDQVLPERLQRTPATPHSAAAALD